MFSMSNHSLRTNDTPLTREERQSHEHIQMGLHYLQRARSEDYSPRFLEQSFAAFAKARNSLPDNTPAELGLAYLLLLNQEWSAAKAFVSAVLAREPEQADALQLKAWLEQQPETALSADFDYDLDALEEDWLSFVQYYLRFCNPLRLKRLRQQPTAFGIEHMRRHCTLVQQALQTAHQRLQFLEEHTETQALSQKLRQLEFKQTEQKQCLQQLNSLKQLNQEIQQLVRELRQTYADLQGPFDAATQEQRLETYLDRQASLKERYQHLQAENLNLEALEASLNTAEAMLSALCEQLDSQADTKIC